MQKSYFMLKTIRNIKFGWIIILMGFIFVLTGFRMKGGQAGEETLLCFDEGCIYIQGISGIVIGILCVCIGTYQVVKR